MCSYRILILRIFSFWRRFSTEWVLCAFQFIILVSQYNVNGNHPHNHSCHFVRYYSEYAILNALKRYTVDIRSLKTFVQNGVANSKIDVLTRASSNFLATSFLNAIVWSCGSPFTVSFCSMLWISCALVIPSCLLLPDFVNPRFQSKFRLSVSIISTTRPKRPFTGTPFSHSSKH